MLNIFIVLGVISNLFFDFYVSEKLLVKGGSKM